MSVYVYHHLGLGDHIICNGLVRHYKEGNEKVFVFVKPHNFKNVDYMYRDDKNIIPLPIGEDSDVQKYIKDNNLENITVISGFRSFSECKFDESFYKSVNLPFEYRFKKFFFERDIKKEIEIYNELNPNNEPYIFVHGVNQEKIRKDLKIIENPTNHSIFDLLTLIEKSTEVHLMESSIKNLVNSYPINGPKFFYHRYIRGYSEEFNSDGINKFLIID
jgi:hypothetical protein